MTFARNRPSAERRARAPRASVVHALARAMPIIDADANARPATPRRARALSRDGVCASRPTATLGPAVVVINQSSDPSRASLGAARAVTLDDRTTTTMGAGPSAQGKNIDGKAIAATIRGEIKDKVAELRGSHGKTPGLAVVIVGERKDSQTYVRMKRKACEEAGIASFHAEIPETATEAEVLKTVRKFNADPKVHGILVQLPLPKHMNEERVLAEISLEKDVDGFHPENIGKLAMKGHEPLFAPCTPKGCIELLKRSGVELSGKNAVVVGRSNIVGMPAALLLMKENCTVTVVHSKTKDPKRVCREADVIVAAAGSAQMVKKDWCKPGVVVIDVGTNSVDDATKKSGYRLVGDVDYDNVKKVASQITPVPGGVGPMTIATLISNTYESGYRAITGKK
jgi:5,10-methylene-tetrahydrofolate dehydrogenase/methenyl tetrahydrofolate cyclohydrolase|tara:strand:+ start:10735 stop:11928 length:1194 start_codon:yes stop_codon:yes gene_type:complete